jgi:Helix-turn-helix domain
MSQKDKIRKHLLTGQSITAGEALLVYGCFRLAARIRELREDGVLIDAVMKRDANGKHYASYRLSSMQNNPLNESLMPLSQCNTTACRKCDCVQSNGVSCDDAEDIGC